MGMLDRPSPNRVWKFCAKADGFLSAELQVAAPGQVEKKGFFSFFTKKRRSYQQEGGMCDLSLRIRARLFFLKARVAAGRLCELRLQTRQGSCKKLTVLDFKNSPSPLISSYTLKGSSSSPFSTRSSALWRVLGARKKKKESLFVCGAGLGAFAFFVLHQASAWATYLPSFVLNAGSCLVSLLGKFAYKKCNTTSSNRAACLWQGIRRVASLFQQMAMLVIRPMFIGNRFVNTALLAILIGVILTGKAGKLQDFLDRKKRGGGVQPLWTRIARKVLLAMQLLKRFWAHIGMKQAFLCVLLLALSSSAVSQLQMFS